MIKQKRIVPGALTALAVGTLVRKARRERPSQVRTRAFRRTGGKRRW
ncbi:MAG TPA: hypothetical protein VIL98_14920 [Gaiellaceae bacterium]